MTDTILVSMAVTAGIVALAGVPLRCWQFYTGHLRTQVPRHLVAQATFVLFAVLFLASNVAVWIHALFVSYRDFSCAGPGRFSPKAATTAHRRWRPSR